MKWPLCGMFDDVGSVGFKDHRSFLAPQLLGVAPAMGGGRSGTFTSAGGGRCLGLAFAEPREGRDHHGLDAGVEGSQQGSEMG